MIREITSSAVVLILFSLMLFPSDGFSESPYLKEGIEQYKEENYDEAVEILEKGTHRGSRVLGGRLLLGARLQIGDRLP
jgi:hypothetical protein